MVAAGEPGHVLALIDPESDLAIALDSSGPRVVQLLEWRHQQLAEAFAGQFPSPGGPFRMGEWEDTAWGPRLADASTWAGVRVEAEARRVGWSPCSTRWSSTSRSATARHRSSTVAAATCDGSGCSSSSSGDGERARASPRDGRGRSAARADQVDADVVQPACVCLRALTTGTS